MFGMLVLAGFGYFLMENDLVWIGNFNSQFIETFLNTKLYFPFDGSLLMCFCFQKKHFSNYFFDKQKQQFSVRFLKVHQHNSRNLLEDVLECFQT